MPYIKRISSIVNGADACGGGMKKAGLVYKSDWGRVTHGNGGNGTKGGGHGIRKLIINTPHNLVFSLPGQYKKICCTSASRGTVGGVILNRATQSTNA